MLLERCLEKEAKDRLSGISDARVDIQKALADPSGVLVQATGDAVQAQPRQILPWVLAAVVLSALTAGVAVWNLKPTDPQPPAARFYHELPDDQTFTRQGRPLVAVSPDGSQIVYVANNQLYLRNLGEMTARPIQGTNENTTSPFFSPDGDWVGYYSTSDDQLKKIAPIGGASVTLCDAKNPLGGVGVQTTPLCMASRRASCAFPPMAGLQSWWFQRKKESRWMVPKYYRVGSGCCSR